MFDERSPPRWPSEPYKGLANYEVEDELLFAGRKVERRRCLHLLAQAETRILILHGQTGCGKSSFLRAGLIPELERNGNGYAFLRRRRDGPDGEATPAFIRCSADPIARIAEEIFIFTGEKVSVRLGDGTVSIVDLEAARQGNKTLADFIKACSKDSDVLLRSLSLISKRLAYTLVLILDQVEEVITQTDSPEHASAKRRFFAFIKDLVVSRVNIRFILAIRKDHSGQFIGSIQSDSKISAAYKTFFLPELPKEGMREAILRPTRDTPPEGVNLPAPRDVYQFVFEPAVVDQMVSDLDLLLPAGSALPVMQIVCRDLVEQLGKPDGTIRRIPIELYRQGEITGRVHRHLMAAIADLDSDPEVGASVPGSMEKWMRVLKRFVQEEGDGRMHTDLVRSPRFAQWVAEEELKVDIGKAIAKLTDPRYLVLRQFTVFAPGGTGERLLLCLGHDLIGNVIVDHLKVLDATKAAEMKAQDDARMVREEAEAAASVAREESELAIRAAKNRARRLRNLAFGLGAVVVAVLGAGIYFANATRGNEILALLRSAEQTRRTDVVASLSYASRAARLSYQYLRNDNRAATALVAISAGLPSAIVRGPEFPPNARVNAIQALPMRARFAILDKSGALQLTPSSLKSGSSAIQYRAIPELQIGADGAALEQLMYSEANDGTVLAMFHRTGSEGTVPEKKAAQAFQTQGVAAFFPDGTSRHNSPDELLKLVGHRGASMNVSSVVGSEVVLIHSAPDQDTVLATIEVTHLQREPVLKQAPDWVRKSSSTPLPVGSHLVFLEYSDKNLLPTPGIPAPNVSRVTAHDVRNPGIAVIWRLHEQDIVKECNKKTPSPQGGKAQLCEVTLINGLQQESGVTTLALWQFSSAGRLGAYGRASVSHLLFLDPRGSGSLVAMDFSTLAKRRRACGHNLTTLPAQDTAKKGEHQDNYQDDDVPDHVLTSADGLTLVFKTDTYAQLLSVKGGNVETCRELYLPRSRTVSWTDSPHGILATTPQAGYKWTAFEEGSPQVADYATPPVVCKPVFDQVSESSASTETSSRAAQIKDICG